MHEEADVHAVACLDFISSTAVLAHGVRHLVQALNSSTF